MTKHITLHATTEIHAHALSFPQQIKLIHAQTEYYAQRYFCIDR